jgi:1-acyl-sn-glycerol-3-phosphate acyltransferase
MFYILIKLLAALFIYLLFWPKVAGRINLKVKAGAMYICNHISFFDPILLAVISQRIIHFMAKSELFKSKFTGTFLKWLYAFPVIRNTPSVQSIKQAISVLESGKVFGIFPEGRRYHDGKLHEFERGAAMLALRTGVPVIPIFIESKPYSLFHRKRVFIGPAVDFSSALDETGRSAQLNRASQLIYDAVQKLSDDVEKRN